jgi:hypothetical protein
VDALPGEPEVWERVAGLEWWLREYGKTPDDVRAMPAYFVARVPQIALLRQLEQEKRVKRKPEGGS